MKVGVQVPTASEGYSYPTSFADHRQILQLAKEMEKLGYDAMWANDRVILPRSMRSESRIYPRFYDVLISLAFLAAETRKVRLGTSVLQLPIRDPVMVAKQVSTLDVFSNGRIMLGVGTGANREEFLNLKPDRSPTKRGQITDEALQAFTLLFSKDEASFESQHFRFKDVTFRPLPLQKPLPIYIAGKNERALRRVAQWGHGWLVPVSMPLDEIKQKSQRLANLLEEGGRSAQSVDKVAVTLLYLSRSHEEAMERFANSPLLASRSKGQNIAEFAKRTLIGTPQEVIDRIQALKEAGITQCLISKSVVDSFEELKEQIQWFADEVRPALDETNFTRTTENVQE